jgi:hypothetical protein
MLWSIQLVALPKCSPPSAKAAFSRYLDYLDLKFFFRLAKTRTATIRSKSPPPT